jgi:two-component system, NtrC family, nitrogen regulation response regulator GlnG
MPARGASKLVDASLIVGDSAEMAAVVEQVREAAATDAPVLIEGEPGTGRELVARTIHYAGPRRGADFVALKATTIPRRLLSHELFGARSQTLRRADGGTLLVKDVEALPPGPQRSLARVLKKRARDAGPSGDGLDVRVIGASDGDLHESVAASFFDRELYERLATHIHIPPLRRRTGDLPELARRFVAQAAEELGRAGPRITDAALEQMAKYPWPGNVAELKDVARRLVLAARGDAPGASRRRAIDAELVEGVLPRVAERVPLEDISFEDVVRVKLAGFLRRVEGYPIENLYDEVIARVERPLLALAMERAQGNQLRAAEILGLNRNTLRKKLALHALAGPASGKRRTKN